MICVMKKSIESLHDLHLFVDYIFPKIKLGTICLLHGEMGMGKTTFVSHFMKKFSYFDVSSPSFSLVQEYDSQPPVFHMDLYRCNSNTEIDMLDLDYYFLQKTHITFVEWAEKLYHFSFPCFELTFFKEDNQRFVRVKENS